MLDSRVDKVGIVVVLISVCCWIAYTTGFIIRSQQLEYRVDNEPTSQVLSLPNFCHWSYVVSGVLLYLTSFVHLLCGFNILSTFLLTFLLPVNFVSGGGILNVDGIAIYNYYTRGNIELSYDDYLAVEFGGALGALIFYWIFMFMWTLSMQCQAMSKRRQYESINS